MFHDESWKLIYLFWGQKVKGHESQMHCWRGSLHSCECWLLVFIVIIVVVTSYAHTVVILYGKV